MQVPSHCTARAAAAVAALLALLSVSSQAQSPQPTTGEATFIAFLNGREVGREQVLLTRTASGWMITSTGRFEAPLNISSKRFEMTYAPDWQPIELKIDASVQDRPLTLATSFGTTT